MFHNVKTGRCDPSVGKIADRVCCSTRRVRMLLRDLEVSGYILAVSKSAFGKANQYELWIMGGSECPPNPEKRCAKPRIPSSAKSIKNKKKKKGELWNNGADLKGISSGSTSSLETAKSMLEKAFLARFQSNEHGYQLLMKCSEKTYTAMATSLANGEIEAGAAVDLILGELQNED